MSEKTERKTVPPRKVSLRRGDSGYSSVAATPATPSMQNGGRKSSRVEQQPSPPLGPICETPVRLQLALVQILRLALVPKPLVPPARLVCMHLFYLSNNTKKKKLMSAGSSKSTSCIVYRCSCLNNTNCIMRLHFIVLFCRYIISEVCQAVHLDIYRSIQAALQFILHSIHNSSIPSAPSSLLNHCHLQVTPIWLYLQMMSIVPVLHQLVI